VIQRQAGGVGTGGDHVVNAVSTRTSNRPHDFRSDRLTAASSGRIAAGGDHQAIFRAARPWVDSGIGTSGP